MTEQYCTKFSHIWNYTRFACKTLNLLRARMMRPRSRSQSRSFSASRLWLRPQHLTSA